MNISFIEVQKKIGPKYKNNVVFLESCVWTPKLWRIIVLKYKVVLKKCHKSVTWPNMTKKELFDPKIASNDFLNLKNRFLTEKTGF